MTRLITALMTELSGLEKSEAVFMAATNFPEKIDSAIMDRISHHIYLPLPSDNARQKFIEKHFSQISKLRKEELEFLVQETEDLNFRDLLKLKQICFDQVIVRVKKATHFNLIPGKLLSQKYSPCFCTSKDCKGIKMSYEDKKLQIKLPDMTFSEITDAFENFKRNDLAEMVTKLESYNEEHGQILTEEFNIEAQQDLNRIDFKQKCCYKINPRKLLFWLFIICALIALIFYILKKLNSI